MLTPDSLRREWRAILELALPLILAEIGWMAMGIVDTVMVGRLPASAVAIGSVSLGSILFYVGAVFAGAMLFGLDTVVSQAFGARRIHDCHRALWNALYLCAILAPLAIVANTAVAAGLPRFGANEAVVPAAASYMRILNWSVVPLLFYFACRRYLQAMGRVKPVMFALLSANLVNVAGNWALIYGHAGFPAMGTDGSAWATVAARVYMASVLVGYALWQNAREQGALFRVPRAADRVLLARLVRLGFPAATHVALEIGVFALATALAAKLDAVSLAGHQIALNAASFTFMVPLGISAGAAVLVGQRIGERDPKGAGRAGWTALACGVLFMGCAAVAFLTIPGHIARIYTADTAVVRTTIALLAVAAAFQLFDGCQIVAAGALRGAGNTHTPMLCNLTFYWFVGLPVGYLLCFRAGWGVVGLWCGLSLGLILIGSTLVLVWRRTASALECSEQYQHHYSRTDTWGIGDI